MEITWLQSYSVANGLQCHTRISFMIQSYRFAHETNCMDSLTGLNQPEDKHPLNSDFSE